MYRRPFADALIQPLANRGRFRRLPIELPRIDFVQSEESLELVEILLAREERLIERTELRVRVESRHAHGWDLQAARLCMGRARNYFARFALNLATLADSALP